MWSDDDDDADADADDDDFLSLLLNASSFTCFPLPLSIFCWALLYIWLLQPPE